MNHRARHRDISLRIAKRYGIRLAYAYWRESMRAGEVMARWADVASEHTDADFHHAMLLRVLRPYMRQHFTTAQRRALLLDHYTAMGATFTLPKALREEPGICVSTLTGKNGTHYQVYIGGSTSKEGELGFSFLDAQGQSLAKLTGTIGHDETGHAVLWIGGLQGAKPPLGRDEIVKATRELFGLRPKGAVMIAAQVFAQELGLTALRAPDNEGHISQRGFRRLRNKRKIYAEYGQFWQEVGGTEIAVREYRIPTQLLVRSIDEVKVHKRAEWKKRQAKNEQLMQDIKTTMAGLKKA